MTATLWSCDSDCIKSLLEISVSDFLLQSLLSCDYVAVVCFDMKCVW